MKTGIALAIGFLTAVAFPLAASAETYTLPFIATANAPVGATGVMKITVEGGTSSVHLAVRGLYPNALYTIWTAFGHLAPGMEKGIDPTTGEVRHSPFQCPPAGTPPSATPPPGCPNPWTGWLYRDGTPYPFNGNTVAPTAPISSKFTDGMGADPGATFVTDANGDGQVTVQLDYDITTGAPIGNSDLIRQSVTTCTAPGVCTTMNMRITGTYLRKFIGDYRLGQRASMCANYDPAADAEALGLPNHPLDSRFWQCVDPDTGLPRVHRFGFEHFRLANHVDALTHGFIGGSSVDHVIDMVGMRACAVDKNGRALPKLKSKSHFSYDCPAEGSLTSTVKKKGGE